MLLRFVRNKCYKGVDYGPDYAEQVADVEPAWARQFLATGSAVRADAVPAPEVEPERVMGPMPAVEAPRAVKPGKARKGRK